MKGLGRSKFNFIVAALLTTLLAMAGFHGVSAKDAETVPYAVFGGLIPNYEFTIRGTKNDLEIILDDVVLNTEYCTTQGNLFCIQKPFLLAIPTSNQLTEDSISTTDKKIEVSFATNQPPETKICDYYNFTLYISDPETGQQSWFEFSEDKGLEEIYVFKKNKSAGSVPYYIFSRKFGSVFAKKDICSP